MCRLHDLFDFKIPLGHLLYITHTLQILRPTRGWEEGEKPVLIAPSLLLATIWETLQKNVEGLG